MKQRIKLTESQLNRVIKESVKRVLKEGSPEECEMRWERFGRGVITYLDFRNLLMDLDDFGLSTMDLLDALDRIMHVHDID